MGYETGMLETPFGPVPAALMTPLVQGPDLLGAVIVLQVLIERRPPAR